MKRIYFALGMIIVSLANLGFVGQVSAVNVLDPVCANTSGANRPSVCGDASNSQSANPLLGQDGIITTVVQILTVVIGIISVIYIILAGFRIITAGGDSQKVAEARNGLIYAIAGIAITVLAQVIITFVLDKVS